MGTQCALTVVPQLTSILFSARSAQCRLFAVGAAWTLAAPQPQHSRRLDRHWSWPHILLPRGCVRSVRATRAAHTPCILVSPNSHHVHPLPMHSVSAVFLVDVVIGLTIRCTFNLAGLPKRNLREVWAAPGCSKHRLLCTFLSSLVSDCNTDCTVVSGTRSWVGSRQLTLPLIVSAHFVIDTAAEFSCLVVCAHLCMCLQRGTVCRCQRRS